MSVRQETQIGPMKLRYRLVSAKELFIERFFAVLMAFGVIILVTISIMEMSNGKWAIVANVGFGLLVVLLVYGVRFERIEIRRDGVVLDFEDSPDHKDKD